MGFPYGADEDAAFMVAWLELYKLEGIKNLYELSKKNHYKFDGKFKLDEVKLKKNIDLNKTSLLVKGPQLFDYLYENTRKNLFLQIKLKNCIDPIFIIPLSYKLSYNLYSISAYWKKNTKIIGVNISKNKVIIGEIKRNLKLSKNEVFLSLSYNKKFKTKNILLNKIQNQITKLTQQEKLKNSIKPNSNHWQKILKLAKKAYVPNSDQSRKKGAGGKEDID